MSGPWTPEPFEADDGSVPFERFYGEKVVLLLGGYDKGKDSKDKRQQREIVRARKLLAQFKQRQRRSR